MKLFVLFLVVLLSACSGVQYKEPTGSESSATLYVDAGSYRAAANDEGSFIKQRVGDSTVYINTVDDEGCYIGKTTISKSIKLYAGRSAILTYRDGAYDNFCRILVSFIPEKDEEYKFIGKNVNKSALGDNKPHCSVSIKRMGSDVPVVVKRLRPRQAGLACIKFKPY